MYRNDEPLMTQTITPAAANGDPGEPSKEDEGERTVQDAADGEAPTDGDPGEPSKEGAKPRRRLTLDERIARQTKIQEKQKNALKETNDKLAELRRAASAKERKKRDRRLIIAGGEWESVANRLLANTGEGKRLAIADYQVHIDKEIAKECALLWIEAHPEIKWQQKEEQQ